MLTKNQISELTELVILGLTMKDLSIHFGIPAAELKEAHKKALVAKKIHDLKKNATVQAANAAAVQTALPHNSQAAASKSTSKHLINDQPATNVVVKEIGKEVATSVQGITTVAWPTQSVNLQNF
jgi:hypothetical protein